MKPVGHDGKEISDSAWRRVHAMIARMEEKYNVRIVNSVDKEAKEAKPCNYLKDCVTSESSRRQQKK